tara:strand:- start:637 stop:1143 length:507 start_codon:yes stop_codon:yes gene_type:complete
LALAAWLNRFIAKFLGNLVTLTRPRKGELIDMNEYIDRNDNEEMYTTNTEPVNTEPVVETPSKSQKKIVSNEQFIRAWNGAEYLSEAAEAMGMKPESARARAAKLRKTFAKAGVNLTLRIHKRKPRTDRAGLADDSVELARLAQIASDTYGTTQTDESENIETTESLE